MLMLSKHLPSTRTLQCYLAVAQELNFRRAAELLNMSQPPLSRQIKGLEEMLRVQLIVRDTHRVSLTTAGVAFKDEASRILLALDAAVAGVKAGLRDDAAGTVRMGLTSVINHCLMPGLNALVTDPAFTGGRALERAWSKRLVERVRSGELDLAIVGDIVPPTDDLALETVGSEAMIVVLPASHPAAAKSEVDLADLGATPLFWFSRTDNPAFYDKCERSFRQVGYAAPRRLEPKDFTLLLAAVAAGEGVALCPQSMQATSRIGVAYRALAPALARLLSIDVQVVSRAYETRGAVLDKVGTIRAALAGQPCRLSAGAADVSARPCATASP
ncbi:LysR family transcriptional regulator [Massilia antarctica]|uniref:LysR family transcriptional regulator n=1 Tax=Massilia antarctica TaxID=2765360 RepID=UPI0006BB6A8D|nr:LysR family transcriptional regulator [Massilia sp. H27-R4]MCY0912304.1 LysR family transcriptional regulator [Massilia sp. H27-R4]CUI03326.1 LysR family regulatory protein CidR [Janthinobacterium sp. CG23_2]CUU27112.1 LysR family regulatory protein CidR [Janthinobacterium sp. CG23_2]